MHNDKAFAIGLAAYILVIALLLGFLFVVTQHDSTAAAPCSCKCILEE